MPRGEVAQAQRSGIGEFGEAAEGVHLLGPRDVRLVERLVHDLDGLIVSRAVHREGGPILSAVREGVARRIAKARLRAIYELRRERESAQRLGADAGRGE